MPSPPPPSGSPNPAQLKPTELIGKRLGRFKVTSVLGKGAMGLVLLAEDITLKRRVALKLLPYNRDATGKERVYQEQFIREARSAAQIIHPAIVQIFEVGIAEGFFFIAMEVLESGSLDGVVALHGPLEWRQAVEFTAQAAEGLAYAHERGVLHRDIKPANLMLADSGHCKLADFGLAQIDDPADGFKLPWKVVGTPSFMAPEVARGKPVAASDIFALAGVLWYLLTGEPPFRITKLTDVVNIHKAIALPKLRDKRPDVPPAVAALVERGLAYDVENRPESAAAFADALRAALASASGVGAAPVAPPARSSKAVLIGIGIAAVALIGIGIAVAIGLGGSGDGRTGPVIVVEPVAPAPVIDDTPPPPVLPGGPENPPTVDNPPGVDHPPPTVDNPPPPTPDPNPPGVVEAAPIPAGGQSRLPADVLRRIDAVMADGDRRFGTFELVSADGQPFEQVGRAVVTTVPDAARQARLRWSVPAELLAGHSYLLTFQLRAIPPADGAATDGLSPGVVNVIARRVRKPYQAMVSAQAPATATWRRVDIPFTPPFSLPKGAGEIEVHLGERAQTIEIADIRLLDYGTAVGLDALPRSDLSLLETPLPDPMPRDPFGVFAIGNSSVKIARLASSGDPRPYLFAGTVKQAVTHAHGAWLVPLDGDASGVVVAFDDRVRPRVFQKLGVRNQAQLTGRHLVVTGPVAWSDRFNRPVITIDDAQQVRLAAIDDTPIAATDRPKLIDAAVFGRTVEVTGKPASFRLLDGGLAELSFEGGEAPGHLRLRYAQNLFAAMTKKFGGNRGGGVVGKPISARLTPTFDPLTGALVARIGTTKDISEVKPATANPPTPPAGPGPQVLRVKVEPVAGEDPAAASITQAIAGALSARDQVVFVIRARSADRGAAMVVELQNGNGTIKYGTQPVTLTGEWREYPVVFTLGTALPARGSRLFISLNHRKATIEIASINTLVNRKPAKLLADPTFVQGATFWAITKGKKTAVGFKKVPRPGPLPAGVTLYDAAKDHAKLNELIKAQDPATLAVTGEVRSVSTTRQGQWFITLRSRVGLFVVVEPKARQAFEDRYSVTAADLRSRTIRVVGTLSKQGSRNQIVVADAKNLAVMD